MPISNRHDRSFDYYHSHEKQKNFRMKKLMDREKIY